MNDTPRPHDPPSFGARESYPSTSTGDDQLPPVEPPNARFIIQLFVVPALIVMMVVGVWVSVSWLVRRTTMRPQDLIEGLETSSVARWQRASELADLLRNERFEDFRSDGKAATQLANILDREIDAADKGERMDQENVTFRYFLVLALGEFRVDEGTDVMLKAATTKRAEEEEMVQRGALRAIATRAFNLSQLQPPRELADPEVEATLFKLSEDSNNLLRSETAYALGKVGTPTALKQLELMLGDPHADTRYNAAIALAHRGNAAAIDTLAEMLDPAEMSSVQEEPSEPGQFSKRSLIVTNAIEAVDDLHKQQPGADFGPVVEVLEQVVVTDKDGLAKARFHPAIVPRAKETLKKLQGEK
jgi:hypothetical protein